MIGQLFWAAFLYGISSIFNAFFHGFAWVVRCFSRRSSEQAGWKFGIRYQFFSVEDDLGLHRYSLNLSIFPKFLYIDILVLSNPWVDESIVPNRFRNVVLPPPDGPLMMTNYPSLIPPYLSLPSNVTLFNATTRFSPFRW